VVSAWSGLLGKDSIFMGNIDEKRLSALLERIKSIKGELETLENDVRDLAGESGSESPAAESQVQSGSACIPADDVNGQSTDNAEEAVTVQANVPAEPQDDTPIDIDIPGIDLPPIIEDPSTGYSDASSADIPSDLAPEGPTAGEDEEAAVLDPSTEVPSVEPDDDLPLTEDLPEYDSAASEEESLSEPAQRTFPETESGFMKEPEPASETGKDNAIQLKSAILDSQKAETAVMDVMADKQAWRTDRPGFPVKNIISAISLNDRVLLINILFKEDPILFQSTISAFNGMSSLDEATAYIQANFPDWDMNSEPVYRLMMAVRRKLK
jgi:hypothetical protein